MPKPKPKPQTLPPDPNPTPNPHPRPPTPHPQVYYDLGAGEGRSVALAWALGLRANGIELVSRRYNASCEAARRLEKEQAPGHSGHLRLMHGSFTAIDFSDADLVFMDSVLWSDETMRGIATAAKALKKGARVCTFKKLEGLVPGDDWEALNGRDHYTMLGGQSWGNNESLSSWYLYKKRTEATPRAALGPPAHTCCRFKCPAAHH